MVHTDYIRFMKLGLRWFGDEKYDVSYLKHIPNVFQAVWTLPGKQPGEVWTKAEIEEKIKQIQQAGLNYEVVESINIHDAIKLGDDARDLYINNYIQTLKNLSEYGVKIICYNFMPVFDWTRTKLNKKLSDESTSMNFDYSIIKGNTPLEFKNMILSESGDFSLPGWEPERLDEIEILFNQFNELTRDELWDNLKYFLDAILPTCEECDIKMAIHPDDSGFEIFGLPRMIATKNDIDRLLEINESPSNGITFCTGSLGSNVDNNLLELLSTYMEKVYFVHMRNLKFESKRSFQEVSHVKADGDIDIPNLMKVLYESNYEYYIRPDHGRDIFGEKSRPGYGLYDRALGAMYINGLIDGYKELENE